MNESEIASNKKWFAFYTRSRAEKQLFTRLTDRGFISFLPLITRLKQWSDRKKKVKEPLIRSYVFVKIEPERILEILKVPGVVGILKYLGAPAVVKDFEIENLKILVDGSDENVEFVDKADFSKGDLVKVVKGPFEGLIGEYVRMKGKYRLIIEIEALGSLLSVEIKGNAVKSLAANS